jgi:hypothetical protein
MGWLWNSKAIFNNLANFSNTGIFSIIARMYGLSHTVIIADEKQIFSDEAGYFKIRSPIKPITIGQLTELLESTNRCSNSSGADFELFYKSSSKTLR